MARAVRFHPNLGLPGSRCVDSMNLHSLFFFGRSKLRQCEYENVDLFSTDL